MGTGVRQGSVEGPFLFLLNFACVIKVWKQRCIQRLGHEPAMVFLGSALKMDCFVNLLVFGPLLLGRTSSTTRFCR